MSESKEAGISAEEVGDYFIYDGEIGRLRWTRNVRTAYKQKGKIAGGPALFGKYRRITVRGRTYYEHILIWAYFNGVYPSGDIDHINHDGTDNHIENLRDVTRKENLRNASLRSTNKSGVNGVYFNKRSGKWEAQIKGHEKLISLGYFESLEEAAKARSKADVQYGYHCNHGQSTG